MTTAQVLFLPWLRLGLAARLVNVDTLEPALSVSADLTVTLDVTAPENNPSATVHLRGPGDVIGIDPRQVVRTEPVAGSSDFEALNFAAVEFDNPDLPWLFTPAAADAQGRLRPWLCLVAVRAQDGVRLRAPGGEPLPVLEIAAPAKPADELPDLAESWAWAHAQLSWPHDAVPDQESVDTLLATRPELSVSRLLCPRRLTAHTDYLACVVPAFEVGRLAGLNLPLPAAGDLAPAWRSGAAAADRVDLPVYFHWAFRTGEHDDFESIVDRLAPRDLSGGVGQRPMDIGRPGFASAEGEGGPVDAGPAAAMAGIAPEGEKREIALEGATRETALEGATRETALEGATHEIALEGALQPVGMARVALDVAAGPAWQPALQRILNAGASSGAATPDGAADPLVGPPIYGRWLAGRDRADAGPGASTAPSWLDELNLDPRERVAAGLGTRVVQAQQDELVAQAWAQAGAIAAANQRLRQTQLAGAIGAKLLQRHVLPLMQGAPGQDDALWRFAAPAQARLMLEAPDAPGSAASMLALVARTSASAGALAAPMRRLTRSRGPLGRRTSLLARKGGPSAPAAASTGRLFAAFAEPSMMLRFAPPTRGFVGIDDVSARLPAPNAGLLYDGMTDLAVAAARPQPLFHIAAEPVLLFAAAATALSATAELARAAPPKLRMRPPGEVPDPPEPPEPPPPKPPRPPKPPPVVAFDSADAAAFRAAARLHLAQVNPAPPPVVSGPVLGLTQLLATQRVGMRLQLDPAVALRQRLDATVRTPAAGPVATTAKARSAAPGAAPPGLSSGTLGIVPRYAMPAAEALARLSQDWLLPGLHEVPADTVALLETNPRFIEAFMVGLNVEMTRELVWRDFPLAHERGTYFDRFWRPARADAPADIAPIVDWGARRLGHNAPTAAAGTAARPLVLLLRSELLRRYPGTAVYAVRGVAEGAQRRPPDDAGEEKAPLFRGALDPDVSFFGFDLDAVDAAGNPGWYFVLQQQPTEPRFGFDEQVGFGGASHVGVNQRPTGIALPETTPWVANAAQLAQLLRQQPVRVLIHASELLPPPPVLGPMPSRPGGTRPSVADLSAGVVGSHRTSELGP